MTSRAPSRASIDPPDHVDPVGWRWLTAAEPMRSSRPAPRRGFALVLKPLLVAGCVFASLAGAGFAGFVATLDRDERNPAGRADGIVALTGGAHRIGDAIDLLAKGYGSRLLITGVNERIGRDEIARLNPGQRRVLDCCVDLDHRARNTVGNAVETRRWMEHNGFRSLIVVTSNYHMPRALIELDRVLPGSEKLPFAVVPDGAQAEGGWRSPASLRILASEYVKFLAAWLRTRVDRPTPAAKPPARQTEPLRVADER